MNKKVQRALSLALALLLMVVPMQAIARGEERDATLSVSADEILAAMDAAGTADTRGIDLDSDPVLPPGEDGSAVPFSAAAGIHVSYELDRDLGAFADGLTLPFEREHGSVLLRSELLEAMEGMAFVKSFPSRQAAVAYDPRSGELKVFVANSSGTSAPFTLELTGDLELLRAEAQAHTASLEELSEEELARLPAGDVELLEVTPPPASTATADEESEPEEQAGEESTPDPQTDPDDGGLEEGEQEEAAEESTPDPQTDPDDGGLEEGEQEEAAEESTSDPQPDPDDGGPEEGEQEEAEEESFPAPEPDPDGDDRDEEPENRAGEESLEDDNPEPAEGGGETGADPAESQGDPPGLYRMAVAPGTGGIALSPMSTAPPPVDDTGAEPKRNEQLLPDEETESDDPPLPDEGLEEAPKADAEESPAPSEDRDGPPDDEKSPAPLPDSADDQPEGQAAYLAVVGRRQAVAAALSGDGVSLTAPGNSWVELTIGVGFAPLADQLYTVTFDPKNGQAAWTASVAGGGRAAEPEQIPDAPAGYTRFAAWYEENEPEGGASYDFDAPVRSDLWLEARYADTHTVDFKNAPGPEGEIIHTRQVAAGQRTTAYTPAAGELSPPAGQVFLHWYEEGADADYAFNFGEVVTQDLVLVPRFSGTYTVTFLSDGTQVSPIQVNAGQPVPAEDWPVEPTRTGYTFLHWSAEKDGAAFDPAAAIGGDLVLYAVWQGAPVDYEIVYWMEKPDIAGDPGTDATNYAFYDKTTAQALTGTPTAEIIDGLGNRSIDSYSYHRHNAANHTEVAGNGTTVINRYYRRTEYTFIFYVDANNGGPSGNPGSTMDFNGKTYSGIEYRFTAKLGQDISGLWPSSDNATFTSGTAGMQFVGWWGNNGVYTGKGHTLTSDLLNTFTGFAYWLPDAVQYTYNTYVDLLIGETGDRTHDGVSYKRSEQISYAWYYSTNAATAPDEFYGLTVVNSWQQTTRETHWYYARNTNDITFNLGGGAFPSGALPAAGSYAQTANGYSAVKYGESLSHFQPTEAPTRTVNGVAYTFDGWYYDAYHMEEVSFAAGAMPDGPLELYAKWTPAQTYTARFYDDTRSTAPVATTTVSDGRVELSGAYTPGQQVAGRGEFVCWQWYAGSLLLDFDPETPVHRDIDLYARWKIEDFTVTYDRNTGTGPVPVDPNTYRRGEQATVLPWTGTSPSNYVFIGWAWDGGLYLPGAQITVEGDMTLTAAFVLNNPLNPPPLYSLVCHSNDGRNETLSHTGLESVSYNLPGGDVFQREGFSLIGWTTTPGGTSVTHALGSAIRLTADMDLYAVWSPIQCTVTFSASGGGSLTGGTREVVDWGTPMTSLTLPQPAPDPGHYFTGWSPAVTDAPVTASTRVTAVFAPCQELTVTARSLQKAYDGTPLPAGGYDVSPALSDAQLTGVVLSGSITNAGSLQITPDIGGVTLTRGGVDVSEQYSVTAVPGTLTVTPVPLTVTAEDKTITAGDPVPPLTARITGFVNGEDEAVLQTPPQLTTTYTPGDAAGDYDIVPAGAAAANYTFTYVAGRLTVRGGSAPGPNIHTVTYHANGGGGTPPATDTVATGSAYAIAQPANLTAPGGRRFVEWNTQADGSGAGHAPGTTITMPDHALSLHAIWEAIPVNAYTVTFHPNGGSVAPTAMQTGADGRLAYLPTPTRSGYTFTGWFTLADGGTQIAASHVFTTDTTLYAQWSSADSSSGGGSSRSSGSGSSGSSSTTDRRTAKNQLPASAFSWDGGRTLTIDHDSATVLGLVSVQWNGQTLTFGADFTAHQGSVIIRFSEEFIAAQSTGNHTVRVEFLNYTGEHTLTLDGTGAGTVENGEAGGGTTTGSDTHNPQTGDFDPSPWWWLVALIPAAAITLVSAALIWRRLRGQREVV